ncbi:hypothetical protein BDV93DRAFT_527568 [Ceratobasidium sp. AG-I]|nr:hypothetical protein BDV93DRAFT_527568 [Ceratobasidium sp. AG-I]
MSHPLVWMAQTMFYPMGNTTAVSLTQDLSPEQDADILLLGCGDPRNILFTTYSDVTSRGPRKMDITCCDLESAVLARNILLLVLIDENEPIGRIWDIFYHFHIDTAASTLITTCAVQLSQASSSLAEWTKSKYHAFLKVVDAQTLSALHAHFTSYAEFPNISSSRLKKLRQQQTALSKKCASQMNLSCSRSAGIMWYQAMEPVSILFKRYWETGTTFSENEVNKLKDATELNPTFVYSMAGERFNPHYGTFPQGFHFAPAFAPVFPDQPTGATAMDISKQQFKDWCGAFRESRKSDCLTIRFFSGEALALCRALDILARTKKENLGLFTAPWRASQIDLSHCESMPTSFDVIDSSNLMDHLGAVNLLVVTQPLLKQHPDSKSVMYTETLLPSGEDATQSFLKRLCADPSSLSLLVGLAPLPYLTSFSSHSNMHEIVTLKAFKEIPQYHEQVVWVDPTSGDHNARDKSLPVSFKATELAILLFDIYAQMFRDERMSPDLVRNPTMMAAQSMSEAHYHRETFAILLQHIQKRILVLDGGWDRVMHELQGLIMNDHSSILGMNHYQDLCLQFHLHGVHTVSSLSPSWRSAPRIGRPDETVFEGWENVPPVVCLVLVVPRAKLQVLMPDDAGSPRLQCNIMGGTAYQNVCSSLHGIWGKLITRSDALNGVAIEEDPLGVHGTADLIISCWASSYVLVTANTTVCLALRLNPISLARFKSLGTNLELFSANLLAKRHVRVLRDRPAIASEVQRATDLAAGHSPLSFTPGLISHQVAMDFEGGRCKVASLTARLEIDSRDEQLALLKGAEVSATHVSPCAMEVSVAESRHIVPYPYPIQGSSSRVRVARKSHYIEIIVPPTGPISTGGYALNPFPIIKARAYSPWTIHQIHLDRMPMLNTKASKRLDWLSTHCAFQLSDRERAVSEASKNNPKHAFNNLKRRIYTMFTHYAEGPTRVLGLCEPTGKTGIYTIVMVGGIRLDLASSTVVLDVAVVPLSTKQMPLLLPGIRDLHDEDKEFEQLITAGPELAAWKKILPAFIERCRTWTHTPNCEYVALGDIPLSLEIDQSPICSCGQGIGFEGAEWDVPRWKGLLPYATRAAISPLFAVSYLEAVGGYLSDDGPTTSRGKPSVPRANAHSDVACWSCGGPGQPKLLTCAKCKKARYCSSACQLKDWKAGHKQDCKTG